MINGLKKYACLERMNRIYWCELRLMRTTLKSQGDLGLIFLSKLRSGAMLYATMYDESTNEFGSVA